MSPSPHVRDLFDLSGRVFLVVGGARDLGLAFAAALAEAGADGVVTSRNGPAAAASAAQLQHETGRQLAGLELDATDFEQAQRALDAVLKRFGRIDILVNNVGGAGQLRPGDTTNLDGRSTDAWERLLRLNLTAPWIMTKVTAALMRRQGGGSIINIASIAGVIGRDRRVYPEGMPAQPLDYAAAKGGLIALTRDAAAALGREGIRVNAISPGGIERNQPDAFMREYSSKTILGRMGRPVDLKGAAVFLASDASAYVTGQNLVVDGGFSVWQ